MTPAPWAPLLDALVEAVCLVDPTTLRIVGVNRVMVALVGLGSDVLLDKPIMELTHLEIAVVANRLNHVAARHVTRN